MNRWNLIADLFRSPKAFPKAIQLKAVYQHATPSTSVPELAEAVLTSIPESSRCITLASPLYGAAELQRCRELISTGLLQEGHASALCVESPWQGDAQSKHQAPAQEYKLAAQCITKAAKNKAGDQLFLLPLDLFAHCANTTSILGHLRSLDATAGVSPEAVKRLDVRASAASGLPSTSSSSLAALNLHPDVADALAHRLATDAIQHAERMAAGRSAAGSSRGGEAGSTLPPELLDKWCKLAEAEAAPYFRSLLQPGAKLWSMRQRHLMQVLQTALSFLGGSSAGDRPPGCLVWGHTSSLVDARSCNIGWRQGEVSLGQLIRERMPAESVFSAVFTTYSGSFLAGSRDAGGSLQASELQPSLEGSYEEVLHHSGLPMFALDVQQARVKEVFEFPMLLRAVGEEYRPSSERDAHYYDASLPSHFNLVMHVDNVSTAGH